MEKEVIILTKSDKNGGYCVAGIDKENGKFIRLVSEDYSSHYALDDNDLIYKDGQSFVKVMDIVRVKLKGRQHCIEQPENYIIDDGYYMKKIGVSNRQEISQYLMNQEYIFYNNLNSISEEELKCQLQKYSLIMFKVSELKLWADKFNEGRLTANFIHFENEYRFIKVTDHNLTDKYYERVINSSPRPLILNNAILIMSLAPEHYGKHYKLVANIIEEELNYWGENPFAF